MAEEDLKYTLVELKKFFSTPDRPVSMKEFQDFWDSCTEEEKEEFRMAKARS